MIRRKHQDAEQKVSMLTNLNDRYNKKCDELSYKNGLLEKEKQEALEQVRSHVALDFLIRGRQSAYIRYTL